MIYYIDIDGVLCNTVDNLDYSQAKPILENIKKVQKLFSEGNMINIWTSRGVLTKIDWRKITKKQLEDWNVPYHSLSFSKPIFDVVIDDKALNSRDW